MKNKLKILKIALDCINNEKDLSILKSEFDKKQLNQSGLIIFKTQDFCL